MSQLDENINKFMAIKDRARKLIQMESNGSIDRIKNEAITKGKISYGNDGSVTTQINNDNNISQYNSLPNNYKTKSKLPTEIIESFKTNPISYNSVGGSSSVLDIIDNESNQTLYKNDTVDEQTTVKQQQTQTNIDYSMIKMIVEDCLRKQMNSIKKTILTENSNNRQESTLKAMKIGNKFSFITDNGDLYEAKLTFIRNVNKKSGE